MHAQCACCAHCLHGRHGADGRRCGLPRPARRRCFSRTTRCTTTTSTTTRCRCNVQDAAKMQVQHGDYERFDRSRRAWAALSDPSGRAMPFFGPRTQHRNGSSNSSSSRQQQQQQQQQHSSPVVRRRAGYGAVLWHRRASCTCCSWRRSRRAAARLPRCSHAEAVAE